MLLVSDCSRHCSFKMNVTISSNWSPSGSLSITPVPDIDEVDLDDLRAEACVMLTPVKEDERGELTVDGPVSAVLLITDAPRWEVLAMTGYLFSAQGRKTNHQR